MHTLQHTVLARRAAITGGACALVAALDTAVAVTGTVDPVRMPTAPLAVPLIAALGGALLVAAARRTGLPGRARTALAALCGAGMLAGSVAAIPHTVLIAVVTVAARVTGGRGPFDVEPQWLTTAAHLVAVVAALVLLVWAVAERRIDRGRCPACGRATADAPPARRSALPWLAAAAITGSLPYGLLKLAWGLGSTVGLTGDDFADVSFTSPGFGDTAVLTLLSCVVAAAMGAGVAGRLRPVLLGIGGLGSFMLLPVAAVTATMLVPVALGTATIDGSEIAPWAFLLVYGSFAVWGTALTALTVAYWRATRRPCRAHHVARYPVGV